MCNENYIDHHKGWLSQNAIAYKPASNAIGVGADWPLQKDWSPTTVGGQIFVA